MNEIKYPSYWKTESGRVLFSVIEPKKTIRVIREDAEEQPIYEIAFSKSFEDVWFDGTLLPATQLEFMKAYNKAHEAIEDLIISVKDPV